MCFIRSYLREVYHNQIIFSLLDHSSEATPITPNPDPFSQQSSGIADSHEQVSSAQPTRLLREINEFESKYQDLTNNVLKAFKSGNISIENVKSHLMQLPVSLKLPCNKFFQSQASCLARASSIEELFWILSTYWDFMNPSLLAHLAHSFGDDRIRKLVDKYTEELREFRRRTKVKDFINLWTGRPIPDYHKIAVEMKDDWNLEQLEEFRIKLSHERWLEGYVLRFDGTKDACVAAIFSLPMAIDSHTLGLENLRVFFQECQILKVFLNEVCIIDLQVLLSVFSV